MLLYLVLLYFINLFLAHIKRAIIIVATNNNHDKIALSVIQLAIVNFFSQHLPNASVKQDTLITVMMNSADNVIILVHKKLLIMKHVMLKMILNDVLNAMNLLNDS